ncbi:hypothetical protein RB595_007968 [Gaeumannomyces hyphopodioides]
MAEIFGTVSGALNVAALFNNCVDCFEYVQLGRHFGRDYERCQLKVRIAQARLSRWGQAVAIHEDARFASASPTDTSTQQIQAILEEISMLFQSVQKTSKRYELGAKQEDLVLFQETDMQPAFQRLCGRLGSVVRQRQNDTSLVKKAAWALYDSKNLDKLIKELTGLVDDLEKIYPVKAARQLVEEEIEEVDDAPALMAVSDAGAEIDPVLAEAAAEKAKGIAVKICIGKVGTKERARVLVGNEMANVFGRGGVISDQMSINTEVGPHFGALC